MEALKKLAEDICAETPGIETDKYYEQVYKLYGALFQENRVQEGILEEIYVVERARCLGAGAGIMGRITDPVTLVLEYSRIAFGMAQRDLASKQGSSLAPLMRDMLSALFGTEELFDEELRDNLKSTVSETELDFTFAAGNHEVASLRMAPFIRNATKGE